MADLGEFLREAGGRVRQDGVWDCCTMPAAWAMACGWPDPMAEYRGAYASEAEGEGLIFDAGGLAAMFARALDALGVPRADPRDLRPGDVGVVEILGEQAGALYTGKRWALVAVRGLAFASIKAECVAQVWRVGNG